MNQAAVDSRRGQSTLPVLPPDSQRGDHILWAQLTKRGGRRTEQKLKTQGLRGQGRISDRKSFPNRAHRIRWPLPTLTTVLLIRVVLTVIVPVAHPGAADALAIVTVEVQRGAGGQHWVQGNADVGQVGRSDQAPLAALLPLPLAHETASGKREQQKGMGEQQKPLL